MIEAGPLRLPAELAVPREAGGIILFAHGSGSSRHSPRNRMVAARLHAAGFATILMDLLTRDEEALDLETGEKRFDIELLADRLLKATAWTVGQGVTQGLPVGYFGASTGAAAALLAAAEAPHVAAAVVSRGGRPDLAGGQALRRVRAATLLIVGGRDTEVISLNEEAFRQLTCPKQLEIVRGASHLFQEPGTLEQVAELAAAWFEQHLARHGLGTF
jgi:dienelactone hydrolase